MQKLKHDFHFSLSQLLIFERTLASRLIKMRNFKLFQMAIVVSECLVSTDDGTT